MPGWLPSYLQAEVCLLETGTRHGCRPSLLILGPDAHPVRGLVDLGGFRLVDGCRCGRSLGLGGGRDRGLELASGGGKGPARDTQRARQGAHGPQLRNGHCEF